MVIALNESLQFEGFAYKEVRDLECVCALLPNHRRIPIRLGSTQKRLWVTQESNEQTKLGFKNVSWGLGKGGLVGSSNIGFDGS